MMRYSGIVLIASVVLLRGFALGAQGAEDSGPGENAEAGGAPGNGSQDDPEDASDLSQELQGGGGSNDGQAQLAFGDDVMDPSALMDHIQERRGQHDSLFRASPLKPLHDLTAKGEASLYDATYLKLGLTFTHLFQGLSESLPGTDQWGTATDMDFVGNWGLINRNKPTRGNLYFHIETRWNYGTTGPMALGPQSLGSLINTGNSYDQYSPAALVRNLYWEQGSKDLGWAFRVGKITPDSLFGSSPHLTPVTTFLTFAGTGAFGMALPDSGLGVLGAYYFNDNVKLIGVASDANGNRYDFGDITEGDFFTALELGIKIAPRTEKSGYSKVNIWHTDGTSDGQPINGMTGASGWGFFLLHEQELSEDGKWVSVFKGGHGFNDSSYFTSQAGASLLKYDPGFIGTMQHDVVGLGFNWADPSSGTRDEYNVELFYRFPMFPGVDTTLSYQAVINPALDLGIDFASAFSFRLRTVF